MIDNFKNKIVLPLTGTVGAAAFLVALIGRFTSQARLLSDIFFMGGLTLVCLAIINILLYASLMSGWFKSQRKGERDEDYQKRKIDVHTVASKKNRPIHFDKFAANTLFLGILAIILAILLTV